jgi:hypothetical protein
MLKALVVKAENGVEQTCRLPHGVVISGGTKMAKVVVAKIVFVFGDEQVNEVDDFMRNVNIEFNSIGSIFVHGAADFGMTDEEVMEDIDQAVDKLYLVGHDAVFYTLTRKDKEDEAYTEEFETMDQAIEEGLNIAIENLDGKCDEQLFSYITDNKIPVFNRYLKATKYEYDHSDVETTVRVKYLGGDSGTPYGN